MKTAVVTGATSGIGKSFAIELAKKGNNLIITGRREEILNTLADELRKEYSIDVSVSVGDLSNREYVDQLGDKIEQCDELVFLINNAGYGNRDSFFKDSYDLQSKMLDVHIYALTKLVYVAGNVMKRQGFGNIINTSSLASFFPIPTGEFYCSTKAFINTFSESIYIDLRQYGIKVQSLCPGFTYTDFHRKLNIGDEKRKNRFLIRWMSADKVATLSLEALNRKESVIFVPGFTNKILYFFSKVIPKSLYYMFSANSVKIPGKKEE